MSVLAEAESLRAEVARLRMENADLKRELDSDLRLDRDHERVRLLRSRLRLTPMESRLVLALYAKRPRTLTKGALMDLFYPEGDREPHIKVLDVRLFHARQKIGAHCIKTVWGDGLALTESGATVVADALGSLA